MNFLILGTSDKTDQITERLRAPFLLIDDGSVIDAVKPNKSYFYYDPLKHPFNPMLGMNYRKARDFVSLLNAVFPEGENTLTRKNSNHILLKALIEKPDGLKDLIRASKEPAELDAAQKIESLLLSPVLRKALSKSSFNPGKTDVVLARLDRKKLGDWPAPGSEDTELGVLMEPEVDHGEAEVYTRVQA